MAEVDFSNARIASKTVAIVGQLVNPTEMTYLGLNRNGDLYSENGNQLSSGTVALLVNAQKQLMYIYRGTFSASGTEFVLPNPNSYGTGWKVSNISFNSGDTYVFQINATLTCN